MSPSSDPDYRALAQFRASLRQFLLFSEAAARKAGLEPQQHQLLLALRGLPADATPTIKTLAEGLAVRHHTAVELVDRLEKKRLLLRRRSAADRRSVLIVVTKKGEAMLRTLALIHRRELSERGPALLKSLRRALAKPAPRRSR